MKYLLKALLLLLLVSFSQYVFSQGIANYNLYMQNTLAINPAYAGSQDGFFNMLHFRNQMATVSDHPRSFSYYAHSPIGDKTGMGGNVTVLKAGVFQTTSANLSASYKVFFSHDHKITFGLSGGMVKRSLDYDRLQNANLADPALQSENVNKVFYNFGFGAIYNWRNFELSASLPNLKQEESNELSSYFIGYANYKYFTKDLQWKFQPSILLKSIPVSPNLVDINFMAEWNKTIWVQAGYRSNNSLVYSAGINIEGLGVGYAYEMPTGVQSELSKGTHEVTFSLLLKNKKTKIVQQEKEIEERYDAFVAKRDSLIGHDSLSERREKAILLEHKIQLEKMNDSIAIEKQKMGEITDHLEKDSVEENFTDGIYDVKVSYRGKVKIQKGNYIVIQSVKDMVYAEKLVREYAGKGIKSTIIYNKTKGVYYLFTEMIKDEDSAVHAMSRYRKKGFKRAWLLVH